MGYMLRVNDSPYLIEVQKAGKIFQSLPFTEAVQQYNENYYYSSNRKALVAKGLEIKKNWVDMLNANIEAVEAIKI